MMDGVVESDVLRDIVNNVESILKLPSDQIDVSAPLDSIGLDSIISMELAANLTKKYQVVISPVDIANMKTLVDLSKVIEKGIEKPGDSLSTHESELTDKITHEEFSVEQWCSFAKSQYGIEINPSHTQYKNTNEFITEFVAKNEKDLIHHYGLDSDAMGITSHQEPRFEIVDNKRDVIKNSDIAIIGISCKLPGANNHMDFWHNLMQKKSAIQEIPPTRWNVEDYYQSQRQPDKTVSKWAGLIDNIDKFDNQFFEIDDFDAVMMDPQQRLLFQETYKAFQDAGLRLSDLEGSDTGVFVAFQFMEYEQFLRQHVSDIKGAVPYSSSSPAYYFANRLSDVFDLQGPSEAINMNCGSSAVALNRAYQSLMAEECNIAVAGGTSLHLFPNDYISASQYGLLSDDGSSAAFDIDAKGFTRGEGVAVVVLKRLEDAIRDRDRIYSVIKSTHQKSRGRTKSLSEIKHESITEVLTACYQKVDIEPSSLQYIEVDGYCTKWGDAFEFEGIKNAFLDSSSINDQKMQKTCALGNLKANIGHLEPVSGLAGVIKVAISLQNQVFPPSISKKKNSDFIDLENKDHPLYFADEPVHLSHHQEPSLYPLRAGVNSFSDSGVNVHILLEEYRESTSHTETGALKDRALKNNVVLKKNAALNDETAVDDNRPSLFILSAKTETSLHQHLSEWQSYLQSSKVLPELASMIYTLQMKRDHWAQRVAIIVENYDALFEKIDFLLNNSQNLSNTTFQQELLLKKIIILNSGVENSHPLLNVISESFIAQEMDKVKISSDWMTLATLWVHGADIDWKMFWESDSKKVVTLPSYSFDQKRFWIESNNFKVEIPTSVGKSTRLIIGSDEFEGQTHTLNAFHTEHTSTELSPSVLTSSQQMDCPDPMNDKSEDVEKIRHRMAEGLNSVEIIENFLIEAITHQRALDNEAIHSEDGLSGNSHIFELGLNSMDIAIVTQKLNRLLNSHISPSTLFKYPKINNLSQFLANQYAEILEKHGTEITENQGILDSTVTLENDSKKTLDHLVPVQTQGSYTPIFAIPGGGGQALSLQLLSQSLGAEFPFYVLEPIGLDGKRAMLDTVEDVASANIHALKQIQAPGPFRLLGYSYGGIVAFEMAYQLMLQGEQVESLTLLDVVSPEIRAEDTLDEIVLVFEHLVNNLDIKEFSLDKNELINLTDEQREEYLYRQVKTLGIDFPENDFKTIFRLCMKSDLCCKHYTSRTLPNELSVHLFKATNSHNNQTEDYGWNHWLSSPLISYFVEADHFSLIIDANAVADITSQLKKIYQN